MSQCARTAPTERLNPRTCCSMSTFCNLLSLCSISYAYAHPPTRKEIKFKQVSERPAITTNQSADNVAQVILTTKPGSQPVQKSAGPFTFVREKDLHEIVNHHPDRLPLAVYKIITKFTNTKLDLKKIVMENNLMSLKGCEKYSAWLGNPRCFETHQSMAKVQNDVFCDIHRSSLHNTYQLFVSYVATSQQNFTIPQQHNHQRE
ncbi:hypothetical protein RB195_010524 [Necator americanus]|uniref:Uncharacterized protein n=1 Tax=Necator americanus TaxID=51031 RepID=A0ABR1CYR6_NECAM